MKRILISSLIGGSLSLMAYANTSPSAVEPSILNLPTGPGSIKGLGEAFIPELNTGTSAYRIPLNLPKGRGQFQPELSLNYNSGYGNNILGSSWKLPLVAIHRQTDKGLPYYSDYPQGDSIDNDHDGAVDEFDEFDTYITDSGEELVLVAENIYRLKFASSMEKYERLDAGWIVHRPDGTKLYLGQNKTNQLQQDGQVFTWHLERAEDAHGNVIRYQYAQLDSTSPKVYPSEIIYNEHAPQPNKVVFQYEKRPDLLSDFRPGYEVRTHFRLSNIAIQQGGKTRQQYQLNYHGTSAWQTQSLLKSIQEFGSNKEQYLPATTFNYSQFEPTNIEKGNIPSLWKVNLASPMIGFFDMNADGLIDIVGTDSSPNRYWINKGYNEEGIPTWSEEQEMTSRVRFNIGHEAHRWADMNGDGRSEMIVERRHDLESFEMKDLNWSKGEVVKRPRIRLNSASRFMDINNDKRIDIVRTNRRDFQISLNLPDGWTPTYQVRYPSGGVPNFTRKGTHLADMNGDGLQDLVYVTNGSFIYFPGIGDQGFAPPVRFINPPRKVRDATLLHVKDINGDGKSDLVYTLGWSVQIWINQGIDPEQPTKAVLSEPLTITSPLKKGMHRVQLVDINGNGSQDILWLSRGQRESSLTYAELFPKEKPFQLKTINNGLGQTIHLEYTTLVAEMKRDEKAGQPWETTVPIGMQVLKKITTKDQISKTVQSQTMDYHNGYYHGQDKAFRGFAQSQHFQLGDEEQPTLQMAYDYYVGRADEVLKGKPKSVSAKDKNGSTFWTERNVWDVKTLAQGYEAESRNVVFAALLEKQREISEQNKGLPVTLKWVYGYDNFGNQVYLHEFGRTESGWQDERITRTRYSSEFESGIANWLLHLPVETTIANDAGSILSKERWYYDDPSFSVSNFGQVSKGLVTANQVWAFPEEETSALFAARYQYDAFGNRVASYGPLWGLSPGHATYIQFDAETQTYPIQESVDTGTQRLTAVATYDPVFGKITQLTDFNGHQSQFAYDTFGRLTKIVLPGDSLASPTKQYHYHLAAVDQGNQVNWIETKQKETTAGGTLDSRVYYDGSGRALMTQSEGEKPGQVVVSGLTSFNTRGQVQASYQAFFTNQYGLIHKAPSEKTEFQYDALGRPTLTMLPNQQMNAMHYEPLVVEYTDEAQTLGNRIGAKKRFTYDGLLDDSGQGRLRYVDEIVAVDEQGEQSSIVEWRTTYDYDALNNFTRFEDAKGNVRSMLYDGLGRNYFTDDPNRGHYYQYFDQGGNLAATRDARGKERYFLFDGAGRIVAKYHGEGKVSPTSFPDRRWFPTTNLKDMQPVVTYHYDDGHANQNRKGKIAKIVDAAGELQFGYDLRGRQNWTQRQISGHGIQSDFYETKIVYDSANRITEYTYPDNTVLRYEYNDRGLVKSIPGVLSALTYNANGKLSSRTLANGIHTDYSFDARERLSGLVSTRLADALPLQQLGYHYDPVSNLTAIDDLREAKILSVLGKELGLKPEKFSHLQQSFEYKYDDLYRLTQAKGLKTYQYRYDSIGNLLKKTIEDPLTGVQAQLLRYGNSADQTQSGTQRRHGRAPKEPAGPHALTFDGETLIYDASGNRQADREQVYTWDHDQQLSRVDTDEGFAQYGYDYDRQRRYKVVTKNDGSREEVIYINDSTELRNGQLWKYVTFGGEKIARSVQNGGNFHPSVFYLNQHIGSVALTTNGSGKVLSAFSYTPYGELAESFGQTELTPYRFTGKEKDKETGLQYFSHRYLDDYYGQFLTPDPIFALPERFTDPQHWSPYAYARNNPITYTDPTGLMGGNEFIDAHILMRMNGATETQIQAHDQAAREFGAKVVDEVIGVSDAIDGAKAIANGDFKKAADKITDVVAKPKKLLKKLGKGTQALKKLGSKTCCFVAGTAVLTESGYQPIESITLGDRVWSKDPETGEQAWQSVTRLYRKLREIYEVTVETAQGETQVVRTTDDHPYWVVDQGWKNTVELFPGQQVETESLGYVTVLSVINTEEQAPTYNLEVANFHTYYATKLNLLVHNCNSCKGGVCKAGKEETTRVRHYTNRKGSKAIEESGYIKSQDNNRVYLEPANKKALSMQKAEDKYQIGDGKGRDYVETNAPNSKLEWVKNPRYGTKELTVKGDLTLDNPIFIRRK